MQQCEVSFGPEDRLITVDAGTSLLQAVRLTGLTMEAPCDGNGTCGKCRIRAIGAVNPPDQLELARLGNSVGEGIRLACRTKVYGFVRAEILPAASETYVILAEGQNVRWVLDPPVRRVNIITAAAEDGYGTQITDSGTVPFVVDNFPSMLRELAEEYAKGAAKLEAIVKNDKILDWCNQNEHKFYGIALDIGTTSVVAELIDLTTGESLDTEASINPQVEFGGDVLTRIAFSMQHDDGTRLLHNKIVSCINQLVEQAANAANLDKANIYEIVVAGNTTMQHLLLGVPPWSLAQAPYRPVFTQQIEVSSARIGLEIAPRGVVTVLPSASAFVGADIIAGLTALRLKRSSKAVLFIDIGTNGEIIVVKDGVFMGTSSAAGPALEGMNITCGCRAEKGAVERVSILNDGTLTMRVIGGGEARGLCGSGLIDLVAELVRCGIIEANGRFAKQEKMTSALATRMVSINGKIAFRVAENDSVFLYQKDIRQVQLAKGAIAAAIRLLLKELHITYSDIEEILVAGAFGFHLKADSLIGIGLLPPETRDKIRLVGNTAKEGAKAVLLNRQAAREIQELVKDIQVRELSFHPEFQDCYVESLKFPTI